MNTKTKNRHGRSNSVRNKNKSSSRTTSGHVSGAYKKKFKFKSGKPNKKNSRNSGYKRSSDSYRKNKGGKNKNRSKRKQPTFDPSRFINTNPVDVKPEIYKPKNDFGTFGLDERIVRTIAHMGIKIPTPIQDQIIPEILKGRDVVGLAETGTGKTAAFLLPLIERNLKNHARKTLILTPTRELAIQIEEEFRKLSYGLKLFSTVCVGGIGINPQIRALRRRNNFVIGTPGRILDLINRKDLITSDITTVVLDEADRMLDMGFIGDIRKILSNTPQKRETLLFSATMDKSTEKVIHEFLRKPVQISVKKKDVTDSIAQDVVPYGPHDKYDTLLHLLKKPEFKRVLIFGSMKHSVEKLSRQLRKNLIKAESIHGNKNHSQRQRSLKAFKSGQVSVLVATDVAARGIHINNVTHVINYDLPGTFEDYVHRIGRTGRAEKRGLALTFIAKKAVKDRF